MDTKNQTRATQVNISIYKLQYSYTQQYCIFTIPKLAIEHAARGSLEPISAATSPVSHQTTLVVPAGQKTTNKARLRLLHEAAESPWAKDGDRHAI
ncbi:MAG: hypothetical protein KQH63_08415 [Desulfobulbaceae bacterium]|nr:hypothetical protein [Desulfobulbaceae bacterium]